jgi:hypothetical protein
MKTYGVYGAWQNVFAGFITPLFYSGHRLYCAYILCNQVFTLSTRAQALLRMLSPSGALAASLTELDLSGGLRLPDETLQALGALPALRLLCIAGRFGWTAQSFGEVGAAPPEVP